MEKKNKNATKKTTKKVVKKQVTKKEKRKKGFTLIELLAVIIILGILMIIAIPSVTKYINDSRKSAYVDTAKEIVSGTRNLVNEGRLGMYDTDVTYYINQECIETENASKSPYGDFTKAYVVVTYNGTGYDYYWTSVDDSGQGIKKITKVDKLDTDSIESDLTESDIPDSLGIDGRSKYMIIDKQQTNCGSGVTTTVTDTISGETGVNPVIYPEGKTKATVAIGDIVTIGNEEFYVVKHDGNDLILLAHYNLKVGNINNSSDSKIGEYTSSDPGYGLQSSEVRGYISGENRNGLVIFSSESYWSGKVGDGLEYPGSNCVDSINWSNCAYVYDSNSSIYQYVNAYKRYLEKQGAAIKSARLLTRNEALDFKYEKQAAWKETSYWVGSAYSNSIVWCVDSDGYMRHYSNDYSIKFGVRPVIVI